MKKFTKDATYWFGVVALGLVLGISIQFVRAWSEPTVAPPGGNLGAPVNTSANLQTKLGNFIAQNLGAINLTLVGKGSSASTVSSDSGTTLVTKDYVDAAGVTGGSSKMIKGSGSSFDCGSDWKIKRCGCGSGATFAAAQTYAAASYTGTEFSSWAIGCSFASFGSQTGSCNASSSPQYAYIAECYQ
jgi:hypothetical protein